MSCSCITTKKQHGKLNSKWMVGPWSKLPSVFFSSSSLQNPKRMYNRDTSPKHCISNNLALNNLLKKHMSISLHVFLLECRWSTDKCFLHLKKKLPFLPCTHFVILYIYILFLSSTISLETLEEKYIGHFSFFFPPTLLTHFLPICWSRLN